MSRHAGIITIKVQIAEASPTSELLRRPLAIQEHSIFDIPREINVIIEGEDYTECMKKIKEEMNRLQLIYGGRNAEDEKGSAQ